MDSSAREVILRERRVNSKKRTLDFSEITAISVRERLIYVRGR